MTVKSYCTLAVAVFALIALLQLNGLAAFVDCYVLYLRPRVFRITWAAVTQKCGWAQTARRFVGVMNNQKVR